MKTLIVYTTKYGSVEKCVSILKTNLEGEVTSVNIGKEKAPNLDAFDTVILGGSIYVGKIQKKLTEYVKNNLPQLLQKRTGLFICAAQPEPVCTQELETAYPEELRDHAVVKDKFGHQFDFKKFNFFEKMIIRKIKGDSEDSFSLDEEKIKSFAKAISGS